MTEPESQTEDETVTSDFLEESTSNTEDVTSDDQISSKYKNSDYEDEANEDTKEKKSWMDKRSTRKMKSSESNLEKKDKQKTTTSDIAKPFDIKFVEKTLSLRDCFPLSGFQLEHRARTTVGPRRRIWRSLRMKQPTRIFRRMPRNGKLWPSLIRDVTIELEKWEKEIRRKRRDVFPCDPADDKDEILLRKRRSDFANRKELGHVRVPVPSIDPELKLKISADCAVGERPGLVDGDYVTVKLPSNRVYANVVLRGLKGMHLLEISSLRERRNTWKFCFYQAIVALLAKTQLRYKYAWSANIDYIYDHAWMLFTHIGMINIKARQRLDDIVVYNYKYSVEVELIQEMKDVVARYVDTLYEENGVDLIELSRKDPLQVKVELDSQKVADFGYMSVHRDTKNLEQWLEELITQNRDYILRTTRFSLAFWQDGLFWYLYNPYRCDEYGFWDDDGFACIMKFCSTDSLRRHLMILLLRAHAYDEHQMRFDFESDIGKDGNVYLDVQLFHVSFHYCQLDNPKLLQRGMSKQPRRPDEYPSDSFEIEDREDETDKEEDEEEDPRKPRERATWLKRYRATTWGKYASPNRKRPGSAATGKARWHQYYVEEPNRLFSLWGEIHITNDMFDEANRGMQTYACYVVCAGMTRIMAPEYWSPKTLDAIVICGDRYYTRSKNEAELKSVSDGNASTKCSFKYLSDRFDIGEILFDVRMLPICICGRLYAESSKCLWKTLERVFLSYHFAILTCENVCLGLFKFCGAYYVCDVNSFGPPFFRYGCGAAYLLRATSFRKFVIVLVLIIGSPERSRFIINPIEILRIVEMDTDTCAKTQERSHCFGRFVGKIPGRLPRFAYDGQKKRRMKRKSERNIIACNNRI